MSGREIAVAAGLVIVAIGALEEAGGQHGSPAPQVHTVVAHPRPQPVRTVIVHQVSEHIVTRVVSGSPLAGWQLMVIVVFAIIIAGGVATAVLHSRVP